MNYYELLGISEKASAEEIKRAYKVQMKKWHPDINKDSEAVSMSAKINEAKETLLNETKRKDYDEYLKQKTEETYQKYSNTKKTAKQESSYENSKSTVYERKTVTKWEYLKDYLKNGGLTPFQKLKVRVLVYSESFLCFILKSIVVCLSFLCFFLSNMILIIFNYLYPVLLLLVVFMIFIWSTKGTSALTSDYKSLMIGTIIIVGSYISSFFLPMLGKKLLSPKIFDLLYNKLDIYLFKKSVGYK